MGLRHPIWAIALTLGAVAGSASALATNRRTFHLEYRKVAGMEACPLADTLRREVTETLGRDLFSDSADERVRVTLQRVDAEHLAGTIELIEPDDTIAGSQALSFRGADCGQLVDTLSLVISLALDRLPATRQVAEEAVAMAAPAPSPPQPLPSSIPLISAVGIGPLGSIGLAPSPALGLVIGYEVRRGRYSLGLEGQAALSSSLDLSQGGRVAAQLFALSLIPCARWSLFGGCLSVTAGAEEGSAQELIGAHSNLTPYLGVGARAFVELPLSNRLVLRPGVGVEVPIVRTTLTVGDSSAWETSDIAGTMNLQLLVMLP